MMVSRASNCFVWGNLAQLGGRGGPSVGAVVAEGSGGDTLEDIAAWERGREGENSDVVGKMKWRRLYHQEGMIARQSQSPKSRKEGLVSR